MLHIVPAKINPSSPYVEELNRMWDELTNSWGGIMLTVLVSAFAGWFSELLAHPAFITALLGPLTALIIKWIDSKRKERKFQMKQVQYLREQITHLHKREIQLKDELISLYEMELPASVVAKHRAHIAEIRVEIRKQHAEAMEADQRKAGNE